jgi:hypothetical protein
MFSYLFSSITLIRHLLTALCQIFSSHNSFPFHTSLKIDWVLLPVFFRPASWFVLNNVQRKSTCEELDLSYDFFSFFRNQH